MLFRNAASYPRKVDGFHGSPERVRIVPSFAPASQALAASGTVCLVGAFIVPRLSAVIASRRHAFASPTVAKSSSVGACRGRAHRLRASHLPYWVLRSDEEHAA